MTVLRALLVTLRISDVSYYGRYLKLYQNVLDISLESLLDTYNISLRKFSMLIYMSRIVRNTIVKIVFKFQ